MAALLLVIIGFHLYGHHMYNGGDLVSLGVGKDCFTEFALFVTSSLLSIMVLVDISTTYSRCFVTQLVNCGTSNSNYSYLLLLTFFGPPVLTQYPMCYVLPITFRLVTCGFCSVLATAFCASIFYRKKHCQCKKCLGIKGVLIQYETTHLQFDEETKLDMAELKRLFNIAPGCIQIAIYVVGSDELIHSFGSNSPKMQLQFGSYYIQMFKMIYSNTCPQTSKKICEPAASPSEHIIPKSKELTYIEKDETIMNVD